MRKSQSLAEVIGLQIKDGAEDRFEIMVVAMLENYNPRLALAIVLYFGFDGLGRKTLQETGRLLPRYDKNTGDVTPERIRQILLRGIRYLRLPHHLRLLQWNYGRPVTVEKL